MPTNKKKKKKSTKKGGGGPTNSQMVAALAHAFGVDTTYVTRIQQQQQQQPPPREEPQPSGRAAKTTAAANRTIPQEASTQDHPADDANEARAISLPSLAAPKVVDCTTTAASLSSLRTDAPVTDGTTTPGLLTNNTAGNNNDTTMHSTTVPSIHHAGRNGPADGSMPLDNVRDNLERAFAESSSSQTSGQAESDLRELGGSQTATKEMEGGSDVSAVVVASSQQHLQHQEQQPCSLAIMTDDKNNTEQPDLCDICGKDMALVVNDCLVICRACGRECYCLGCEYRLPKNEQDLCRACLSDQQQEGQ